MYWRIGRAYRKRPREDNKAEFRGIVTHGPAPGLLAFDGVTAVGWCQITPRDALPVAYAKAAGAPAVEAYPLDARLTPSATGTGYASTFRRAGFKVVARRTPPRPIMRLDFAPSSPLA